MLGQVKPNTGSEPSEQRRVTEQLYTRRRVPADGYSRGANYLAGHREEAARARAVVFQPRQPHKVVTLQEASHFHRTSSSWLYRSPGITACPPRRVSKKVKDSGPVVFDSKLQQTLYRRIAFVSHLWSFNVLGAYGRITNSLFELENDESDAIIRSEKAN